MMNEPAVIQAPKLQFYSHSIIWPVILEKKRIKLEKINQLKNISWLITGYYVRIKHAMWQGHVKN